jgi:rod shape-determining protein MreB and related proteins
MPTSTHSKKSAAADLDAAVRESVQTNTLLIGLDWGTNRTCLMAAPAEGPPKPFSKLIPTVVGYAREGILDGILPDDSPVHFGAVAQRYRLHLKMVRPLSAGVIRDKAAARDFALHLRELITENHQGETRAVIGVPARADMTARENVRDAVTGVFDKVILIPEPFLAALGYRDETKLGQDHYVDPVVNSLFIDIGGGSTDLCVIQGYYPQSDDQISIPFAGDAIDEMIASELQQVYPDNGLSVDKIRAFKEVHSYVGDISRQITVDVNIGGKLRKLEIGEAVGNACNALLDRIFAAVKSLIAKADGESIPDLLQNIIVTGGGAGIEHLAPELEKRLVNEGFDAPKVRIVGDDYKEYVSRGALKAARHARERQWQKLIG